MIDHLSKIDHLEWRFLASLILTLIMSYTIKNRTRNHNLISALLILLVAFDYKHLIYILTSISLNVFLLRYTHISEYSFTFLNILVLYIYKVCGIQFEDRISGSFDISGVLMMITIKMCYLGKEYDRDKNSVKDSLSYLLFIPGLILGPVPSFSDFMRNQYEEPKRLPYEAFLKSLGLLLLFQVIRIGIPRSHLFEENISFFNRMINLYLFTVGNRLKFYFAWHFSHGCFIFQNFHDLLNVDLMKVEFARDLKDVSSSWNICTGLWLKNCFFIPMKSKSIFWASLATSAISALWHGINPCYLIMFISLSLSIPVVKGNNKLLLRFCPSLHWIGSRVQMLIIMTYFTSSFFILNVSDLIHVWKSVYFIGHLLFISSLILQSILRFIIPDVKMKEE